MKSNEEGIFLTNEELEDMYEDLYCPSSVGFEGLDTYGSCKKCIFCELINAIELKREVSK